MWLKKICFAGLLSVCLSACQDEQNRQSTVAVESHSESAVESHSETAAVQTVEAAQAAPALDYSAVTLKLLDISEREVGTGNAIVLLFNAPLQADQDFSRYIEITPKLSSYVEIAPKLPEPVLSADGRQLQYNGISPQTKYKINLVAGLKAENGSKIDSAHHQNLTTRKMPPVVSFKSKDGAVLVPGSSDDLQLYSVNVAEADLNIYRVKADQVASFFRNYRNIAKSGAYYYKNSKRAKMVEHLYTARLKTNGQANQRRVTKFSLADKSWANESGVYFATVGKPGVFEFDAATWFSVSSIGLQVRKFPKHTYIIAQDIKTGKLLSNVQIDLLNSKSKRYASETTNSQGVVELKRTSHLSLILARQNNQVTVLPFRNPRFDLSDFAVGGLPYSDTQLFAYAPRDIYRPGETVTISILKRNADGQVRGGPLSVKIFKPDGSKFKSVWVKASDSENGYYQYSFDLPKSSQVGNWQANISAKGNKRYSARFHFKVEEFLPERLRLTLGYSPELQSFTPEQGLQVAVLGEYLYGAPAAGNKLSTRGRISAWSQPFKQWRGYHVGDPKRAEQLEFELKMAHLDKSGKHISRVKQNWKRWKTPVKVRLYYGLFESGGRAVNRNYDTLLWPKSSYIAVKPAFADDQSESNSRVHFKLLKLDQNGAAIASGDTKVELVREEVRYFWSYNENNGWHYERIAKEYVVDSRILSFTDQQPLDLQEIVEWGAYRLELTDLSAKSKTVYRFRAGEPWYNNWQSNSSTIQPDRINLALDKASYLPGEQLTLRLAAPHTGTGLISIETDKILYQQQIQLNSRESTVTLTVPEGLKRHDAYISAFVIAPSSEQGSSVAKRSFGIIHLPLTRSERNLDVRLDVAKRWAPDQQVIAKVLVKDQQGKALSGSAKLTLSAVDSGVLSVTGYKVDDPYQFFYGQRAYQGKLTDMYDQVLEPLLADAAQLRWGGDAQLKRGGDKPESEVQIVSLFSGLVDVKNGIAEIPLDLPAFDGELKLTAVAFNKQQFGKAEQSVVVASPVVTQIALPKFLAIDDSSEVALDITNVTKETLSGELSFKVGGTLLAQSVTKKLTLLPQQKQTLRFTITAAQATGSGELSAQFVSADETLTRRWSLPVRAAQAAEYQRSSALLMPGDKLSLPANALAPFLADTRRVQLRVGLSPNLKAAEHWRYLTKYPYGCLEQTTSKSRPFAAVLSSDGGASSMAAVNVSDVHVKAQGTLARYSELQRADGSFGLWSKTSPEEHWLTAYATEFLYQLKDKGVTVPQGMLDDASHRLESYLSSRSRHQVKRWSSDPKHYTAAYRAYAAYVLAKQAKITLGPLRDVAERDLPYASGKLPGVHLGLAMLMTGSEAEGEALILRSLSKKRSHNYLGDYGSDIRDNAMVINALLSSELVSDELKQQALAMLPDLADAIAQQRWLSTQERSAILSVAMTVQQQYATQKWLGELKTGEQLQSLAKQGEFRQTLASEQLQQQISFSNTGDKPVYAAFDWLGVPKEVNYQVNNGIKVSSEHFLIKNGTAVKLTDKTALHSGDVLLSHITLFSDTRVPDALLVNLMPAGVELENQNLNNSLKLADLTVDGETPSNSLAIQHQEFRDDRYVAAIDIPEQQARSLYIISRAVNPGSYVFPAVRVESMYKPAIHGTGGNVKHINVAALP